MLAAIYGLQAIIFLLNRKFEMIGWMIVYIIGIPIWSFFLPLYSFWHMDVSHLCRRYPGSRVAEAEVALSLSPNSPGLLVG